MLTEQPIIITLFVIFAGAALVATAMLQARQALIVGYILAGVLLGPWGLGWVADTHLASALSEVGIIFLLFLLGLDLTPQKLLVVLGRTTIVTTLTSLAFFAAGWAIARVFGFTGLSPVLVGVAAMFSSTIVGIKLLPTTVLHHRHTGEVIISVLLLQDLLAIIAMMGLKALEGESATAIDFLRPLATLPLLVTGAFVAARWGLLPLFRRFDRVQEYVFLLTLAWCLGIAEAAHWMGLSYEIGAFIAGVVMATSPISLFIADRLKPLRDFFLVLFFFALGAILDLGAAGEVLLPAAVLAVVLLALKPALFRLALGGVSESPRLAWETGWRLGQMSEFSLLIALLAVRVPGIDPNAVALVQIATVMTFVVSSSVVVLRFPTPVALNERLRRD